MGKWDFTRFRFKMSFRWISDIAQPHWSPFEIVLIGDTKSLPETIPSYPRSKEMNIVLMVSLCILSRWGWEFPPHSPKCEVMLQVVGKNFRMHFYFRRQTSCPGLHNFPSGLGTIHHYISAWISETPPTFILELVVSFIFVVCIILCTNLP